MLRLKSTEHLFGAEDLGATRVGMPPDEMTSPPYRARRLRMVPGTKPFSGSGEVASWHRTRAEAEYLSRASFRMPESATFAF